MRVNHLAATTNTAKQIKVHFSPEVAKMLPYNWPGQNSGNLNLLEVEVRMLRFPEFLSNQHRKLAPAAFTPQDVQGC